MRIFFIKIELNLSGNLFINIMSDKLSFETNKIVEIKIIRKVPLTCMFIQ